MAVMTLVMVMVAKMFPTPMMKTTMSALPMTFILLLV
jgi:hypothetical protein